MEAALNTHLPFQLASHGKSVLWRCMKFDLQNGVWEKSKGKEYLITNEFFRIFNERVVEYTDKGIMENN